MTINEGPFRMRIFARHSLVPATLAASEPALLLEGDWPEHEWQRHRWSLDSEIDAREGWIDPAASALAEQLASEPVYRLPGAEDRVEASLAWINALGLRYYLVKLLRVVAFFQSAAIEQVKSFSFHFQGGCDDEYRRLIEQIAWSQGRTCRFEEVRSAQSISRAVAEPPNSWPRRVAGEISRRGDFAADAVERFCLRSGGRQSSPILLCGNPRVLDPVCHALRRRRQTVYWLYDRFAFGNWLTWRRRGVRQLVSNSSLAPPIVLSDRLTGKWSVHGIDLATALEVWLERTSRQRAASQQHLWRQVETHVHQLRPAAIVLDEDATPLKRIAVAAARRNGAASLVVQHGAPRVRFGFAPLAADRFLAWGEASRQQLHGWGVPRERIAVTGSASDWPEIAAHRSRRSILLFTTVPPSDGRPDAVQYHLTRRTHDRLIDLACAAVTRLPGYELVIKLHPRTTNTSVFGSIARSHPNLRFRTVTRGSLQELLAAASCVLNCGSSAGIEAASYGWPVIELLPAGSIELTPVADWGMLGAASTAAELDGLLQHALAESPETSSRPQTGEIFAAVGPPAANRVVDAILSATAATTANLDSPRPYAAHAEAAV